VRNRVKIVFTAGAAVVLASAAAAQDVSVCAQEYMVACAGCDGESGRCDGPLAGLIEIETPNLTMLAEQAGEAFTCEGILLVIDRRNEIRADGSEMPV
jgi:hypothetical protein